jgi:hypothetical protein
VATESACSAASARATHWASKALRRTEGAGAYFNVLSWYKGPLCLEVIGDAAAARVLLQRFEVSGGRPADFHPLRDASLAQALKPPYTCTSWSNAFAVLLHAPLDLWRNYRNAWIACGAHRAGVRQLSGPALDRLASTLSPTLGAVPHDDRLPAEQRIYDIGTNASVAHAMIIAGRLELACRLGEFIKVVVMRQEPSVTHIYQALGADGQPLSVARNKLIQRQFWVEVGVANQSYWIIGFVLKVLALLYKHTNHAVWLEPAARIKAWLARCHQDAVANISSAKLAWGAAEMFAVTADRSWHEVAAKSIAYVARSQSPDGAWMRSDYPAWFPQPLLATIDTSVERMFYLIEVPRSLREGGLSLAT